MSTADLPVSANGVVTPTPAQESAKQVKMESTSHRQILKSSAIVGGSSVIQIVFGVVRTKIMAVLLGPAGIGLVGVLDSIVQLARTLACLGIDGSGVRQIAEAKGKEEQREISLTLLCVRRACIFLGFTGSLALYLLRYRVSEWSFRNTAHAGAIGWLSVAVFFCVVSAGQTALLQGLRKIWEYATVKIAGAVCALVFSVPVIYVWGQDGIVAYLLIGYLSVLFTSWWHARKVKVSRMAFTWREQARQFRSLAKWGAVFLATASLTTFVAYASRALVSRYMGLDAAGQFQAALALSSIYVGFILSAMGTDFYPMLTANAHDNSVCNKLVNEQVSISLLIGIPGILGTLIFAEWIVKILYSGKFFQAADILYWQMPGVLLRVAVWPIGIALAAKGCSKSFLFTSLIGAAIEIALLQILAKARCLELIGVSSTVAVLIGLPLSTMLLRRSSGFVWTPFNTRLIILGLLAVTGGLAINVFLIGFPRVFAGVALVAGISWYSINKTAALTGHGEVYALVRDIQARVKRKILGGI